MSVPKTRTPSLSRTDNFLLAEAIGDLWADLLGSPALAEFSFISV